MHFGVCVRAVWVADCPWAVVDSDACHLCGTVPNDARHHANVAPVWRQCNEWHKAWALDPKTRHLWNMTHALAEDEHRPRPAREASVLDQVTTADSPGELTPNTKTTYREISWSVTSPNTRRKRPFSKNMSCRLRSPDGRSRSARNMWHSRLECRHSTTIWTRITTTTWSTP